MTFYEIDQALMECFDAETGEADVERLEALQGEKDKKIESIALWTLQLAADEKALDEEIERLTAKWNAIRNKKNKLREFLAFKLNGEKFKTPLVSVSCRQTKSVVIDDIDKLPKEFVETVTEKKVDKTALRKAFDEWTIIDGAHIEAKQSVTIR